MRTMNRRAALRGGAGALSSLLIRGLASGLPPAYLLKPSAARAQMMPQTPQTLILSTSSRGDPINVNCPGSYTEGVYNNPELETRRGSFGGDRHRAARVWCDLPRALRRRLAFVHYSPRTAAHPEYSYTMSFRGEVKQEMGNGSEMFASAMAQEAYTQGVHLQPEPIPVCSSFLTYKGQPLQLIKPAELRALFSVTDRELADLRQTRNDVLDALYSEMKVSGTQAQRAFVERYATSREQARNLGERLGEYLTDLSELVDDPNGAEAQVIAAVALAKLNITPVITVNIPFGGDNHQDVGLIRERDDAISGVEAIKSLWNRLNALEIQNQVTFATMNVFGRRGYTNQRGGRDHNAHHAVMVTFGSEIQGGVYGRMNAQGRATTIGQVQVGRTMEAAGTSLAHALGHRPDRMNTRIPNGRLINGFLKS